MVRDSGFGSTGLVESAGDCPEVGYFSGTVKRALAAERPPEYERAAGSTGLVESTGDCPEVYALLPVAVIAERIPWVIKGNVICGSLR